MNTKPLRLQKRLIQFNNLVFVNGSISDPQYTASFKGESQSYTNGLHGSYYGNFGDYAKLETSEFEASIELDFSKLNSVDEYTRYLSFAKRELARSGKLWAVQGSDILWTNAKVLDYNEVETDEENNKINITVRFEIIDGYWVIASRTRTFISEYASNNFSDYDKDYCSVQTDGGCYTNQCVACEVKDEPLQYAYTTNINALCNYSHEEIADMFAVKCPNDYFITYDADLEVDRFCYDTPYGKKHKLNNLNPEYGNTTEYTYCSATSIPTDNVQVVLTGYFENPTITINDKTVSIQGFFEDQAIIIGDGLDVAVASNKRDIKTSQSIINQSSFDGIPFFQIKPGINTIKVTGNRYNTNSYIYIKPLEITY